MSLETGSFINDLVATNPEGTDPKSQGDDHLRLLKAVLKSQFAGFTEDVALNVLASNLNLLGGIGSDDGVLNIDTPVNYHCFLGINAGFTGTAPPGGAAGDMVVNICWRSDRIYQLWVGQTVVWHRRYAGSTWGGWLGLSSLGVGQTWQDFTGSRALDTDYVNNTGRAIQVVVGFTGSGNARAYGNLSTSSFTLANVVLTELNAGTYVALNGTVNLIVPPGVTYRAGVSTGSATINSWRELR